MDHHGSTFWRVRFTFKFEFHVNNGFENTKPVDFLQHMCLSEWDRLHSVVCWWLAPYGARQCHALSAFEWIAVVFYFRQHHGIQSSAQRHQIFCTSLRYSAFWPIYCSRVLYIEPVLIRSDIMLIQDYCGFGTCMLGQKNDIRLHFLNYNCGGAPTNQTIEVFIEDKAKEWSNRDLTLPAAFGTFVGHPGVKQVCPCVPLINSNMFLIG